jgi:hypothetical protein
MRLISPPIQVDYLASCATDTGPTKLEMDKAFSSFSVTKLSPRGENALKRC